MINCKKVFVLHKIIGAGRCFIQKVKQNHNVSLLVKQNNNAVKKYELIDMPLPLRIDIETLNRCNGSCSFCPCNVHEVQRPYAKMTEDLFHKIINELVALNYKGSVALFDNNEPFLDERIIDFQKYVKEKLPDVFCDLWCNGTVLTLDKFIQIMPYLDRLVIDNYSDDGVWHANVKKVMDYIEDKPLLKNKVVFYMRKKTEVLTSRGGSSPNKKDCKCINSTCVLPFQQLNIRPDGKISLCCNDALGKVTLGDVNIQSIEEVWNSPEYTRIRETMKKSKRKNLFLCNHCDTLGGIFDESLFFSRKEQCNKWNPIHSIN